MTTGLRIALVCAAILAAILPTYAQDPSVDELLARALAPQHFALAPQHKTPYQLRAAFDATLTLVFRRGLLNADATGLFREWQGVDDRTPRRHVTIEQLHLPLLLRPFTGVVRHVVEEKVNTVSSDTPDFHEHDFFLLDTLPGNLFVIGGVHHSVVSEVMDRYDPAAGKSDPRIRRLIAQWLYTSPLMRAWIKRPGSPYALETTVDGAGFVHTLTVFYDWGRTITRIAYAVRNGELVWTQVVTDIAGEIANVGPVRGQFALTFTDYWLDYK